MKHDVVRILPEHYELYLYGAVEFLPVIQST